MDKFNSNEEIVNNYQDTEIDITSTFESNPKTGYRLKMLPFNTIYTNSEEVTVKTTKSNLLGDLYQLFKG